MVGHLRYWLETVGPELRQYIVTANDEERPFSRDQRRWVYASSKLENNYFGFGTDNDLENLAGLPDHQARTFPGPARAPAATATRASAARPRKVLGGPARPPAGLPADVGRQHLRR